MKKAVAIISTDSFLSEKIESMKKRREQMSQRIQFIMKQLENERKKCHDDVKPTWEEMTDYLISKKLIPSDYREKDELSLHFEEDEGVIYLMDEQGMKKEMSLVQKIPIDFSILSKLFGGKDD